MGLSIHYSGVIKNNALISSLVEEVDDVCSALDWKVSEINDEQVNGIVFSPKNCEPLFLTFNTKGEIVSPALLQFIGEPATVVSVKTQFAGIDVHIVVINFLKYLSQKYFSVFELQDEGRFWETNDKNKLETNFKEFESAMDFITDALKNMDTRKNEASESLAERLAAYLKNKMRER